ncbi:MAG TPA: DUF58 domain-containing protein [Steroidobacteraceae bacterium]|nr:DUF58 domain-containing protein [Steroidobacteraceae bacterium]
MRLRVLPSKLTTGVVAAATLIAAVVLLLGGDLGTVVGASVMLAVLLTAFALLDFALTRREWRAAGVRLTRRLPSAFAIGVKKLVHLQFESDAARAWHCEVFDHCDASLRVAGLPARVDVLPRKRTDVAYEVVPTRRGEIEFLPADVRIRSRFGLVELLDRLGAAETRRAYPDFAQVARYAWLAGDRRLQEIGIKTYQQRGEGTDFKQLAEYRYGDPIRHIDWKATLRQNKPILREFQDERDQCVMLLVDCGRRMRAYDADGAIGSGHFDQVLNAVMLLSYVALKQGDAVGALTFGTPPGEERLFAPRKGAHALNALMGELYSVQPTPTHSDYVSVAQNLLRRHHKRSLVIVITNFRDEDSSELKQALRLLRSRHLVLLASLRERVVGELIGSPLESGDAALDVGSAHLYEQSRRDAFNRLAARDALMVDAEPQHLGIELVNRYHAVKRAGMI